MTKDHDPWAHPNFVHAEDWPSSNGDALTYYAEARQLKVKLASSARQLAQVTQERDDAKALLDLITRQHGQTYIDLQQRAEQVEAQLAALQRAICGEAAITEPHAILALAEAHRADSELVDRLTEQLAALRAALEQLVTSWRERDRVICRQATQLSRVESVRFYSEAAQVGRCADEAAALLTAPPQDPR